VRWRERAGSLAGFPDGEQLGGGELLELPCTVLVPAAAERQITAENAPRLRCRVVLEAANGPTTPAADRILADRGIPVLPDVLANAGGVAVSYIEWLQGVQRSAWQPPQVERRLRAPLQSALARVMEAADRLGTDYRTAALAVAVERVAQASRLRAIYP
jgi:glutamate dehydrogenase (NAD(P)+)